MKEPKKVSFRIRKQYYDAIVCGEKTGELRKLTSFWIERLLCDDPPQIAVFVCGHRVHRRMIEDIYVCTPEDVLGRELSQQGQNDIPTELCIYTALSYGQCDRCYSWTDKIIPHRWQEKEDPRYDYGEWVEMNTCWSCDHDIINGGDPYIDLYDLMEEREEQEYYEDPVNNPPPSGWMR